MITDQTKKDEEVAWLFFVRAVVGQFASADFERHVQACNLKGCVLHECRVVDKAREYARAHAKAHMERAARAPEDPTLLLLTLANVATSLELLAAKLPDHDKDRGAIDSWVAAIRAASKSLPTLFSEAKK